MELAEVWIWGKLAGALAWRSDEGYAVFEFDPEFRKLQWDIAPLKMSIYSNQKLFSFPALRQRPDDELDTYKGLPGMMADALPDRYGNTLINAWLAQQGRPANSMNPIETLCFIGSRAMGALEFVPSLSREKESATALEIDSLVSAARSILHRKMKVRTNMGSPENALNEILSVGTSAGGARPKAIIAYNQTNGEVRSGQTNAPEGFEHWIIKLDSVSDVQLGSARGYGRVEMAYYNMARACGIDMMPSTLLEENGRAHFMTRRFDRESGDIKHHVQTLCAIAHFDFNQTNSFSYEQLFQTMRELKCTYAEAEQMFRRMVFNVLARNCDDHTKNFAFLLKKDGHWQLAPAYDLCHAYKPGNQWVSQHALSINGKRNEITGRDLLEVGKTIKTGRSNWSEIIDEIMEQVNNWKSYANAVGVQKDLRDEIDRTIIRSL